MPIVYSIFIPFPLGGQLVPAGIPAAWSTRLKAKRAEMITNYTTIVSDPVNAESMARQSNQQLKNVGVTFSTDPNINAVSYNKHLANMLIGLGIAPEKYSIRISAEQFDPAVDAGAPRWASFASLLLMGVGVGKFLKNCAQSLAYIVTGETIRGKRMLPDGATITGTVTNFARPEVTKAARSPIVFLCTRYVVGATKWGVTPELIADSAKKGSVLTAYKKPEYSAFVDDPALLTDDTSYYGIKPDGTGMYFQISTSAA